MKIKDCEVGLSYTGLTYIHVNTVQHEESNLFLAKDHNHYCGLILRLPV